MRWKLLAKHTTARARRVFGSSRALDANPLRMTRFDSVGADLAARRANLCRDCNASVHSLGTNARSSATPLILRCAGSLGAAVRVFKRVGCSVERSHPGFEDTDLAFWGVAALELDLRDCGQWWRNMATTSASIADLILRP